MARRHNMHAYDPSEIERLRGVPLPTKIKCGRCHKNMYKTKYSEKQLTDLRYQISKGIRDPKPISCQTCTGTQVVELECTMCHKTKGLEDFARSQRNKPDTAKCFRCTDIQVTSEPVNHDRYEDPNKTFVTPDSSAGRFPDYWSCASSATGSSTADEHDWSTVNGDANGNANASRVTLCSQFQRALSINGSVPETLIEPDYSSVAGIGNSNTTGDGWSDVRAGSWHTKSTGTTGTASFDGNRYGNPSATSRASTQRTYASSIAERSEVGDIGQKAWAKIPRNSSTATGSTRSPFIRPAGDTLREIEEAWAGSDEEEEEEEEDSNSDDSDGANTII